MSGIERGTDREIDVESVGELAPAPTGTGCDDCIDGGGWWFHLRRCVDCGAVGCCDSSIAQHARRHSETTGHRVATSFEPGEHWFWDYVDEQPAPAVPLSPPFSRPESQPAPGPEGRVPEAWRELLH
ncbi:UBP-type zinc finger domain-containing protein [Agromyces allii]|uniref:UBP-type zinc finger domain-containing protein n=1 Tax=Agromyces allii TaxID=393607 RepID=A0ABP5C816_9MICO|nr:UBP-type zinc finger domain-containing protein [Agromyces allii]